MNKNKENIRKMVESMADQLKQKGINIVGGAVINNSDKTIEGFGEKPPKHIIEKAMNDHGFNKKDYKAFQGEQKNSDIKSLADHLGSKLSPETKAIADAIISKITDFAKAGRIVPSTPEKQEEKGNIDSYVEKNCTCDNCYRYENFEKEKAGQEGTFDYAEVELGEKLFGFKYWLGKDGLEEIVTRDITGEDGKEDPLDIDNWGLEQLEYGLKMAIEDKEYEYAQEFISRINALKNKE